MKNQTKRTLEDIQDEMNAETKKFIFLLVVSCSIILLSATFVGLTTPQ